MIRFVRCECSGDPHWVQIADQQYNYKTGELASKAEVIVALEKILKEGEATFVEAAALIGELQSYNILGLPCSWLKEETRD
jgi:hypothetical protein